MSDAVASSYSFKDPANAITRIFWDIEDFPIPSGLDPESVCLKIKAALDLRGEVSISAYFQDKTLPDEVLEKYKHAGITLRPLGVKCSRLDDMIMDILWWVLDDYDDSLDVLTNLVVISRNIPGNRELNKVLECFYHTYRYDNVVVVLPDNFDSEEMPRLPAVNSYWLWKSLLDGQEPINQSLIAPLLKEEVDRIDIAIASSEPDFHCEECEWFKEARH